MRVQALRALGRIGDTRDAELLVPHLSSPDWWQRYRAARAWVHLTGLDASQYAALMRSLDDPYAKDIINHVRDELEWHLI